MRPIRFYVDADLLALARALVQVRYDVTYPGDLGNSRRGRPPCVVQDVSTKDRDWIPVIASQELVVISRDRRIGRSHAEIAAVLNAGLRVVFLDVRRDPSTWGELKVVVGQWRQIESLVGTKGPILRVVTATSFRPYDLTLGA